MATMINTITVNKANYLTDTMTWVTASSVAGNGTAIFEARVSAPDGRWFIELDNCDGDNDASVVLKGGAFVGAADVRVGAVEAGRTAILFADSAICKNSEGNIQLEVTNARDIKLRAVEFLPAECK